MPTEEAVAGDAPLAVSESTFRDGAVYLSPSRDTPGVPTFVAGGGAALSPYRPSNASVPEKYEEIIKNL
jgi:hypothetical protein